MPWLTFELWIQLGGQVYRQELDTVAPWCYWLQMTSPMQNGSTSMSVIVASLSFYSRKGQFLVHVSLCQLVKSMHFGGFCFTKQKVTCKENQISVNVLCGVEYGELFLPFTISKTSRHCLREILIWVCEHSLFVAVLLAYIISLTK